MIKNRLVLWLNDLKDAADLKSTFSGMNLECKAGGSVKRRRPVKQQKPAHLKHTGGQAREVELKASLLVCTEHFINTD